MKMTAPRDQLRDWLAKRLRREIPDPVWEELDRDQYVASALESAEGRVLLLDKAKRLLRRDRRRLSADGSFSGSIQDIVREVIPERETLRSEVMSDHWARHAGQDYEVWSFRRRYLGNRTVSRQRAQAFMEAHDGDERVRNDVKRTCARLVSLFNWNLPEALIFLFTGKPPLIEGVRVDRLSTQNSGWGNSARVTLSFDLWVSKSTILRVLNRLRRIAGQTSKRPIERKALELANLVSETMFHDEPRSQRAIMEEWNKDFPEWAYTDERHFARDCKRAKRTILFMNLGPPELGPGEEYPGAF